MIILLLHGIYFRLNDHLVYEKRKKRDPLRVIWEGKEEKKNKYSRKKSNNQPSEKKTLNGHQGRMNRRGTEIYIHCRSDHILLYIYIQVILVSIVLFGYQKRPCFFLIFYLVKLVENYTEVSIDHALYVLLKSSFYLLLFADSMKNNLNFSHFSSVLIMVPHTCFFLSFFSLN